MRYGAGDGEGDNFNGEINYHLVYASDIQMFIKSNNLYKLKGNLNYEFKII